MTVMLIKMIILEIIKNVYLKLLVVEVIKDFLFHSHSNQLCDNTSLYLSTTFYLLQRLSGNNWIF
jgi:hypothetical protein